MTGRKTAALLLLALVWLAVAPSPTQAQISSGPAAHYGSGWDPTTIFYRHHSWGNTVGNAVHPPATFYCVHPDFRPGQVLRLTANGQTVDCLIFDMVQPAHQAQWRARWALEVDWHTFHALGLDRNNHVVVHGLAGSPTTTPAPDPVVVAAPDPCRHFEATGHSLCHGFRDYWESNGGLAIFGYPLTGEIQEDGLTVQYMERAVFEYHPDNPPEHRVLLRRLGAEALR